MPFPISRIPEGLRACGLPMRAVLVPAVLLLIAFAWLAVSPPRAAVADFALVLAGAALVAGVAVVYATIRPAPLLASLVGGMLVLTLNGVAGGVIALLGFTTAVPRIDGALASIDAAFGIEHRAIVTWLGDRPIASEAFDYAYKSSGRLMIVIVVGLALTRRYERLREHLSIYTICLAACVAGSVALPAIGVYAHLGLVDLAAERLPPGAGIYHLSTLERLKAPEVLISPFALEGVVTFPSFHACMALMIWYAVRDVTVLRWVAALVAGVTLVATVPIGGHYVVDLAAGSLVFVTAAALSRNKTPQPTGQPAAGRSAPFALATAPRSAS